MKKRILSRHDFRADGIFGYLEDENGNFLFFTLEHAYPDTNQAFLPKIAEGIYQCAKGKHTLEHHPEPFDAFEIQGVPDFQGRSVTECLLHMGNYNADSEGCILLGKGLGHRVSGELMITNSIQAFNAFMDDMKYDDEFQLEIKHPT